MLHGNSYRNRLLCGLFLGLLGFAGNWFKFELFFNVDFLFGSFFVMLAIVCFGSLAGVVAGVIASSCTFMLWNHPWAIVILTAEAMFVAWSLHHNEKDCLTADILFWIFLGTPLVGFFYYYVLHVGFQSTLLIALKQSINGVFNALLASAVFLFIRNRSRNPDDFPSFQGILFVTMVSIILIPSFIYLVVNVRDDMRIEEAHINDISVNTSRTARNALELWLRLHHQDVRMLATLVGSPATKSPGKMQHLVELAKQTSPDFLRMGVLDRNATIVAYSPLVQNGIHNIGKNFADRPFIPILKNTLQPYIPDMVPGKLADKVPILPLLVPMADKDGYAGYCVGIANLDILKSLFRGLVTSPYENITLLDRNGNVVVSTRDDLRSMDHFQRSSGATVRKIRDGYYQWIPEIRRGSSVMSRWMGSLFVSETFVSSTLPWKVVVEISPRPLLIKLTDNSVDAFLLMTVIIILSALFARYFSNRYVGPLQLLERETKHIPEVFEDQFALFDNTSSRIKELFGLHENFRQMTLVLHEKIQELRRVNEIQLSIVEKEKKHLHEKEMLVKDLHDGIGGLLTKISMLSQFAKSEKNMETCILHMDKIFSLAYEGTAEVRSFMNSLEGDHPAWGDLLADITEHSERILEHNNIELSVTSSIASDAPEAGVFRYVNIVRIYREAVANILKHANANKVQLKFDVTRDRFALSLSDDGVGYETSDVRKRGLANMYSRAALIEADLSVVSSPSLGTTVSLVMPFEKQESSSHALSNS